MTHKKLTVRVKPKSRRYSAKVRVKGYTKHVKVIGKLGRTPKSKRVIPPLKKGSLGVSFSSPVATRRKKLVALAKRIGEKRVAAKLRALAVLNKRTNPNVAAKAKSDARYINGAFRNKKFVGKGKGSGSE